MNHPPISIRPKLPFLITVHGTVMAGGSFLTGRPLDEQPELVPETSRPRDVAAAFDRTRVLVRSEF